MRLRQELKDIQLHFETMYRYTAWRKYPIERWENLCDYLKGNGNQILTKILYSNIANLTNVNHTCPYKANDTMEFITERFSGDLFELNYLLPAGNYRMNQTYVEGVERHLVFRFEIYFAISDHRLWH